MPDTSAPMPRPTSAPAPWSKGRYRLLVGALAAAALVALVVGVLVTDTAQPDAQGGYDAVERFVPAPGDEVLRQAELGIDLAPGYDGTLALNGVAIPEEDLRRVREQNEVYFTPGEGKAVERLLAGSNCVTATVWKASDGAGTANDQTVEWCFEAT